MVRRGALLLLLLALAACGRSDPRAPFTDSRVPPQLGPAAWPPQGWAWGLIDTGLAPPQRYGVAAPAGRRPLAQLLVLPGYGGLAEEVFPQADVLTARGVQVWALDGVGQGGSGRIARDRDLGHVDSFQPDVAGLSRMVQGVIRPDPDSGPLVVVAAGAAAPVLLRGLQQGLAGPAAVVLAGPRLVAPPRPFQPRAAWARRLARWLGLDRRRAPGESGWRREPSPQAGAAAALRRAWMAANPDLRMGGPSLGWLAAFDDLLGAVRAAGVAGIRVPVLILADPASAPAAQAADARLCRALPRCAFKLERPAQWPKIEEDFVESTAHARDNPLETRGLPITGDGL